MGKKREVSVLIPYKIQDKQIFVYLQKRSKDFKILPNHFAFFGGKIEEDENPHKTLEREIQEEMSFIPKGYRFFNKYNFTWNAYVYILKVENNFEDKIKVMEGDYGRWFDEKEILDELKLIDEDKLVLQELYNFLRLSVR